MIPKHAYLLCYRGNEGNEKILYPYVTCERSEAHKDFESFASCSPRKYCVDMEDVKKYIVTTNLTDVEKILVVKIVDIIVPKLESCYEAKK